MVMEEYVLGLLLLVSLLWLSRWLWARSLAWVLPGGLGLIRFCGQGD